MGRCTRHTSVAFEVSNGDCETITLRNQETVCHASLFPFLEVIIVFASWLNYLFFYGQQDVDNLKENFNVKLLIRFFEKWLTQLAPGQTDAAFKPSIDYKIEVQRGSVIKEAGSVGRTQAGAVEKQWLGI